ncbi:MAG TPA: YihA family ribosome biogenesis GTP-binding protein [Eggerthellaceae bacterium]|nr:YihA family ribosome biogenesis GTP-binding protein [Eggerthellaceae bacterium]
MADISFKGVSFERSYGTSAQLPESTLPEISFAGRSNVGKSSLLNKLCNHKGLAKVSQTPGKTATINFFDAKAAYLVDLPGYGYARVSLSERDRWAELIEGYFNQDRNFALVCSLIDIRHPASQLDENMVGFLQEAELPYLIVLTKGDKLSKSKCSQQRAALKKQLAIPDDVPMILTSSLKGDGIDKLRMTIAGYVA